MAGPGKQEQWHLWSVDVVSGLCSDAAGSDSKAGCGILELWSDEKAADHTPNVLSILQKVSLLYNMA